VNPPPFRYRRMGYVAMQVTDLARTTSFATDVFGLDPVGKTSDGGAFFRSGTKHHDVLLTEGDGPAFVRAAYELESDEQLDQAFHHYNKLGWAPAWLENDRAKELAVERAFRVHEPMYGIEFEYFSQMTYITEPVKCRLTSFKEFGHFGMFIPNVKAMTEMMVKDMGFAMSDYIEGWRGVLLRARPNPNHHSFAPLGSPTGKLGFHHLAFMVNSIDDIGTLFNRIKRYDVKIQFGIGRHTTSGSIHLYIYDPDHIIWEYTLGMEQFPELNPREPRRMSGNGPDLDLWGAQPDEDTLKYHIPVLTSKAAVTVEAPVRRVGVF
jgi:2,3-dihydroxy-p-cumate/2,3-dihydroxybenzoate 3,4-dioxygenase